MWRTLTKPKLSVCIITRNSEDRLARVIAEALSYGDEVVVGVDAASTDGTFDVASKWADVVYRFRLPMEGQLAPARLLALEHASGDWVFSLDDDESMEPSFDRIVPSLMKRAEATHYYFPRKYLVSLDPPEYVHAPKWFPDWQLRLFRNDPAIVWKPPRPHSGYWVQGLGFFESRASLLHFEHELCGLEGRRKKNEVYRKVGNQGVGEHYYNLDSEPVHRLVELRQVKARRPPLRRRLIHPEVRNLKVTPHPPWGATILDVRMIQPAPAGSTIFASVRVCNTGKFAWWPQLGARSFQINLSFHLLDATKKLVRFDGERCSMPQVVPPGGEVEFIAPVRVPEIAGEYLIEWDLVSEGECWFAQCGSQVHRSKLEVC